MSLGTGAVKVSGEGPEEYKHCREASMVTRQAGTTLAAPLTGTSPVEILTRPDTYLLSRPAIWEGRAALMNPHNRKQKALIRSDR